MKVLVMSNSMALHVWLEACRQQGHSVIAIEGHPPEGDVYLNCERVTQPIDFAWRNTVTGETVTIEYQVVDV